jgi:hypothetical protein
VLEERVLAALSQQPLNPRDLVGRVTAQQPDATEPRVREVMWRLLDRGAIAVTRDWKLQPIRAAQARRSARSSGVK